jgi:lipid II:glycine glycyltransferase (peptidoglycan interpeptide bridge formation enzyme)
LDTYRDPHFSLGEGSANLIFLVEREGYRMGVATRGGALFLSNHGGNILAGAVFSRVEPRVHYLYGAIDSDTAGKFLRPLPIIGRVIEWAKEIGRTEFDFGGCRSPGDPLVRAFKEGFGGEIRIFVPAYSLTRMPIVST